MTQAAPLIILAGTIAALLAAIAIRRAALIANGVAAAGLLGALAIMPAAASAPPIWTSLFTFGAAASGFIALILAVSLLLLVISAAYWPTAPALPPEEFPLLLLIATIGACTLAAAASFITLFLGLETMTLAIIGMVAYPRDRPDSAEAALKYLILSGMSSAFLLFGIGLLELATGTLSLPDILTAPGNPMTLAAFALIGIAAGFKLSIVPFHIWVPDVYAGAPAPSGAYLAVIPKIAVLAILVRIGAMPGAALPPSAIQAITVIAMLSMLAGNLLALQQQNLKRILGYSSIAHLGYLLVAILAAGAVGHVAVVFYIVTYALTMIAAFGVIAMLSTAAVARDADRITDVAGLFWTRPALAAVLTLALLSLAGIPPAIGFIAKMYIFAAGIHTDLWLLIFTMIASSVIGLFYYLTIIIAMTQKPLADAATPLRIPAAGRLVLTLVSLAVFIFGIAPQPLISLVKAMFG
jgi:NADH-quinone oxidoreductase subunit N